MAQQLTKLKSRVKGLEEQLFEKNEELQRYQTMGNAADEKIQALGKIHNDKIRSLMNSIQTLKKENASLQNQGKEHKRSKLISQLNKQIDDQDAVIDILRDYVYKKEGKEIGRANCDNMIISALTKGPDRIRALSREELKIEIERLKNQILLFKTNKKEANQQQTEVGIRDEKNNVLNKSVISEQSSFENANEQLLKNLQELKTDNEALRLQIKSNKKIIESLTSDLKKSSKVQIELTTLRSDLEVAQRKVDTLESLLKQTKENSNTKIIQLYEREIKVQELELQTKQTNNKLNQLQQNHGMKLEELTLEKEKVTAELDALTKENERLIMESSANKKRQEDQKNKINEIRDLNNKQKDELTAKLTRYEQQIARILRESDQKSQRIAALELQIKQEHDKIIEEKMMLVGELEGLKTAGATKEQISRLRNKEKELQQEIRRFKQIVESGAIQDSSTGNDILQMRIKSYEQRIEILENRLKLQGKITDKELQNLGSKEWYEKYVQLVKQFQHYKLDNKGQGLSTKVESRKAKKPVELIQVDKEEKNKLDNMSSGLSNMGLDSVDGRILNNYDSDFEYSLQLMDKHRKGVPKLTENNKELLKLINSDLWEFIKEDKMGNLLEDFAGQYDSNYEGMPDNFQDIEWDRNIKQLEELRSKMRKGPKIDLYKSQTSKVMDLSDDVSQISVAGKDLKGYDSDININLNLKAVDLSRIQDNNQKPLHILPENLGRIQDISSNLPSSVEDLEVSEPRSGESRVNVLPRKKASRDKGSRLPSKLEDKDSDYQGVVATKLKLNQMNSDVSMTSSIKSEALNMVDSDVSVNFRKKK